MRCEVWEEDEKGWPKKWLRNEDAEPECGKDFCDTCGDCLHCYGGDDCGGISGKAHLWVKYMEDSK